MCAALSRAVYCCTNTASASLRRIHQPSRGLDVAKGVVHQCPGVWRLYEGQSGHALPCHKLCQRKHTLRGNKVIAHNQKFWSGVARNIKIKNLRSRAMENLVNCSQEKTNFPEQMSEVNFRSSCLMRRLGKQGTFVGRPSHLIIG